MQGRSRENTLKMVTRLAPGSESRGVVPDRRGERSGMRVPVAAAAPCLQHSQSRAPRFPSTSEKQRDSHPPSPQASCPHGGDLPGTAPRQTQAVGEGPPSPAAAAGGRARPVG